MPFLKFIVLTLFIGVFSFSCSDKANKAKDFILAENMAVSDINRNPEPWMIDFRKKPKWEYSHGLMMSAYLELYKNTGNKIYLEYVQEYTNMFVLERGNILTYNKREYNIDRVSPGKYLMELYKITGDENLVLAIENLRDQMRHHPRTSEGGFWHKMVYANQIWLEGLYMGAPFLAQYAKEFNEPQLFDDVALQFIVADKNMYDSISGLYYHGWDESRIQQWSNPESGVSSVFWGRSIGWLAMGLTDALSWFPNNHPQREALIAIANKVAQGAVKHQDQVSGLWWQVVDQPGREGNYLEATASVMITYFLAKSVRLGYIDKSYATYAKKAYDGINSLLIEKEECGALNIKHCCIKAGLGGRPYSNGTYYYYVSEPVRDNDPKGVGPYILASIEMVKLEY